MAATNYCFNQFRSEISKLIAEIEACMPIGRSRRDREYRRQRRAFQERCSQAEDLTRTLSSADPVEQPNQWALRDGDAYRIHESLKLSLDYFRRDRELQP